MTRTAKIAVVIALAVFIGIQAQRITLPWVNEFEGAFQEMIALHHLESGLSANHFLPVIAEIDGQKFYHTAHPPLLHVIYALLYQILGVHEWVTRAFSLLLLIASIFLAGRMLDAETRPRFWLFALFNPLSFRLGMTTNYELLSIASISLFVFSFERRRAGKKWAGLLLLGSLLLILLSDWPAYLAIPAMLMVNLRDKKSRNELMVLLLLQAAFLAGYLLYAKSVAGEAALFAHGQTRSNPLYIFQAGTYGELFTHLRWMLGWPALILTLAALVKFFAVAREKPRLYAFWIWFLILLWLSAANLTSRHFVYLLYFFPLLALALAFAASNLRPQALAAALVLLSFVIPDYTGFKTRDARGYYFAREMKKLPQARAAFSSAALGTLFFYDKIETVAPVSGKAAEALGRFNFDMVIMDTTNPEVQGFTSLPEKSGYEKTWSFPDMTVYTKRGLLRSRRYPGPRLEPRPGNSWQDPKTEVVWLDHRPWLGIRQPAGPKGISALDFAAQPGCLSFRPALIHAPISGRGDGAGFLVTGRNGQRTRLLYSRFIRRGAARETEIKTGDLTGIRMVIESGPRRDFSFDDAYWLDAEFNDGCGGLP